MNPPPKMSREKPRLLARLAPWIGALIVLMGATQAGLTFTKGGELDMRMLGTGLLITGGGASLIAKKAKGLRLALFLFGALGAAAAVVMLARR